MSISGWIRFPGPDGREDLGYGRKSNKFHKPRTSTSTYPYKEEDDYEYLNDEEIDMDLDDFAELQSKVRRVAYKNDPYSIKGTNPFHYAGAASKLSERALDVKNPPQAIDRFRPDIGPGTSWYGSIGNVPSAVGVKAGTRPTGTRRGWSAAPDVLDDGDEIPRYRLEDFEEDDEEIILRQFIRTTIFNKEDGE